MNDGPLIDAIRENLSPQAVAAIISILQVAGNYRTASNNDVIDEVAWFHDLLLDEIGPSEFNRLADEIGM